MEIAGFASFGLNPHLLGRFPKAGWISGYAFEFFAVGRYGEVLDALSGRWFASFYPANMILPIGMSAAAGLWLDCRDAGPRGALGSAETIRGDATTVGRLTSS